jgi:hypothetical protein
VSEPRDVDHLAEIDTAKIRTECSIVDALESLETVSGRVDDLDPARREGVALAVHAARRSLVEALRRCGREES